MNKLDLPYFPVAKKINGINKYQRFSIEYEQISVGIGADTMKQTCSLLKRTKIPSLRVLLAASKRGVGLACRSSVQITPPTSRFGVQRLLKSIVADFALCSR